MRDAGCFGKCGTVDPVPWMSWRIGNGPALSAAATAPAGGRPRSGLGAVPLHSAPRPDHPLIAAAIRPGRTVEAPQHLVVREPQDGQAEPFERVLPLGIVAPTPVVAPAVDIDDEPAGWDVEIGYVRTDRHLPADLHAERAAAQPRPQQPLRDRRLAPEPPGDRDEAGVDSGPASGHLVRGEGRQGTTGERIGKAPDGPRRTVRVGRTAEERPLRRLRRHLPGGEG